MFRKWFSKKGSDCCSVEIKEVSVEEKADCCNVKIEEVQPEDAACCSK